MLAMGLVAGLCTPWELWRLAAQEWRIDHASCHRDCRSGSSLAGCSSLSLDAFKATPPTVQVQLESVPPGADAQTSLGPGCKTPCSVDVSRS